MIKYLIGCCFTCIFELKFFKLKRYLIFLLFLGVIGHGQNPAKFKDEVAEIGSKYENINKNGKPTVVFTGSSSIRIWDDLQELFPGHQIINSGFGGSKASDLLFYLDELVLQYKPAKVFIYEGDNDIANFKSKREILKDFDQIIGKILADRADTEIVLIAAKPSLARWHLKGKYRKLNRNFRKIAKKSASIAYANVWDVMLEKRKVRDDIFLKDGLHMNSQGYKLWHSVIKDFMN